jgi:hypothetical protein
MFDTTSPTVPPNGLTSTALPTMVEWNIVLVTALVIIGDPDHSTGFWQSQTVIDTF